MSANHKNEKIVIDVEVCKDCRKHQWNTHHKEEKYDEAFNTLKRYINDTFPEVEVRRNYRKDIPRTGAFEVTYKEN